MLQGMEWNLLTAKCFFVFDEDKIGFKTNDMGGICTTGWDIVIYEPRSFSFVCRIDRIVVAQNFFVVSPSRISF